jgi:hypothetical protein
MAELDLDSLSPEERRRLLNQLDQVRLNIAQEQLLQTYNPNMQAYEFKKPENFGQAVGNIFKNRVVNPLQETFGYREPLSDVVDKYRISGYQADENQRVVDELSRRRLMNNLANLGVPIERLQGLDYEKLQNVYTNLQSTPVPGPYGGQYTVNALTGEVKQVVTPSSELQGYFFDNPDARPRLYDPNARPGLDNPNATPGLDNPNAGPGLSNEQKLLVEKPPISFADYELDIAERKERQQRQTTRFAKADDRAFAAIDAFRKPILQATYGMGDQRADLNVLRELIQNPNFETGAMAPVITAAREFGIDLGLNVENPAPAQVFDAISKQIALPLVKRLGSQPTDTDLKLILDSAPSLSKTKEGNQLLIETIDLKMQRDELIARALMEYEERNQEQYISNPHAYKRGLDRLMLDIQNTPRYKELSKTSFKLRAKLSGLLGNKVGAAEAVKDL